MTEVVVAQFFFGLLIFKSHSIRLLVVTGQYVFMCVCCRSSSVCGVHRMNCTELPVYTVNTAERTELISHGFHLRTLYILPLHCHPVVLIMTVFDLQLSLSHRDPSQREALPTTPCCVFKSEAQAAT